MKSIFENVISRGEYDLTGLLKNIDRYHAEGRLTDGEREELYAQARKDPRARYDVAEEIRRLWAAIRELRGDDAPADEWPDFAQPTGGHDAYQSGDQVVYNGKRYRCAMDGCVWSPDVLPDAWEVVSE